MSSFRTARRSLLPGLILSVAIGCGGGGTEPDSKPVATQAVISPGPNVSLESGKTLLLTAEVRDQFGAVLTGTGIRWVSSNENRATVDANGLVTGFLAGATTVTVMAGTKSLGSISVTVLPGPPTQLSITSSRIVTVDSGATFDLAVNAADVLGNALSPVSDVLYSSSNGIVATTNGRKITAVRPGQALIVAQAVLDASKRDSILLIVTSPAGPVLLTDLTRFDLKSDTTFTVVIALDMRTSGEKLGSTNVQIRWDPAVLTYQSDADGATLVGATVNATSASTGTLRLSVANPTGYAGRVELRRITFRANLAEGRTGNLTLGISELNGVSPNFTNLIPATVAVSYPLQTR